MRLLRMTFYEKIRGNMDLRMKKPVKNRKVQVAQTRKGPGHKRDDAVGDMVSFKDAEKGGK